MPAPLVVVLRAEQSAALEWWRDHDPTPDMREQAAAILKVAAGQSLRAVARAGLLRPRRRETIATWVRRDLAEGTAGLRVRPGRGRKPAFPPPHAGGSHRRAA